ncbi:MAG: TIGR01906 family membrane protein [Anaerolineales bacterium]|nr:TIGR01906 family membrane protein [Anaerolineales bacterium]
MDIGSTFEKKPSALFTALSWIVTLLTPAALVLTGVRLLMFPAFLDFEYNTPNFPPDPYDFTKEERLYWSKIALDYLLNPADISFLGDLRFEDGAAVYNERELRHMVDVKIAVRWALTAWYISLAGLLALGLWSRKGGWWGAYRAALSRGGWLTAALVGALILFSLLSFGIFFVAFHNMFFEAGTWMFNYSDTLIRLFPERFWRDIFIYVGVLAVGSGLALGYGLKARKT